MFRPSTRETFEFLVKWQMETEKDDGRECGVERKIKCSFTSEHNNSRFLQILHEMRPGLKNVDTVEECDVILSFCLVASTAKICTKNVLERLPNSADTKPVVLVVLHKTSESDTIIPDSSTFVSRTKTLTVDCLVDEEKELICCPKNGDALIKVAEFIIPETKGKRPFESEPPKNQVETSVMYQARMFLRKWTQKEQRKSYKFFSILSGHISERIKSEIVEQVPHLKEVTTMEECDVIFFFCIVCSRLATDIEEALQHLDGLKATKPAILLVLHHTFNPEKIVPDSSRCVIRRNPITADLLFHEDKGLLQCQKNTKALSKVAAWLKSEFPVSDVVL